MERLVISIGICSAVMSAISVLFIALTYALKNVWSAKSRYYLWIVVLLGFLTPIKPVFGAPLYEVKIDAAASAGSDFSGFSLCTVTFWIWMLGTVILTAHYIARHIQFCRCVRRLSVPCDGSVRDLAKAIAAQMGIQNIKTVILPGIGSPMMTGFRTPLIMLPQTEYSETQLRLIIRHELSHFKRYDLVYKILVLVCRAVHWFNPFMPIIVNHIERECELTCDEIVMKSAAPHERKLYCESLLRAAAMSSRGAIVPRPVLASDFARNSSYLKHRLSMIVSNVPRTRLSIICIVILCAVILSGTFFAVTYSETENDVYEEYQMSVPVTFSSTDGVTTPTQALSTDTQTTMNLRTSAEDAIPGTTNVSTPTTAPDDNDYEIYPATSGIPSYTTTTSQHPVTTTNPLPAVTTTTRTYPTTTASGEGIVSGSDVTSHNPPMSTSDRHTETTVGQYTTPTSMHQTTTSRTMYVSTTSCTTTAPLAAYTGTTTAPPTIYTGTTVANIP